jgi:hypothetical protein
MTAVNRMMTNRLNVMQSRPYFWRLVALLLLTFWLGVRDLDRRPLWADEQNSMLIAGIGPYGPISPLGVWRRTAEDMPPLSPGYFIALNAWSKVAGFDPVALRVVSLLFGLLAVAATYRLGTGLVSRRVGFYAAVVLGTSILFVFYLTQIRFYAPLVFFVAATTWAYLRIVRSNDEPKARDYVILFGAVIGMFYVYFVAVLALAALGAYHLLFVPKNRRWARVTGVMIVAAPVCFLWIPEIIKYAEAASGMEEWHERALNTSQTLERLAYILGNGSVVLSVAALLVGLLAFGRQTRGVWFLFALMAALWLLVNATQRTMHEGRLRYFLLFWPFAVTAVSVGLASLDQMIARRFPRARGLALVGWAAFALWSNFDATASSGLDGANHVYPMQVIERAVERRGQAGDLLVNFFPDDRDAFPINTSVADFYFDSLPVDYLLITSQPDPEKPVQQRDVPDAAMSNRQRVWVASMPDHPPATLATFQTRLDAEYSQCSAETPRENLSLALYAREPMCCGQGADRPLLRFGSGIELAGIVGLPAEVHDSLPLVMAWSLGDVPIHLYSVSLQAFAAEGEKVAQADYGLDAAGYACTSAQISLNGVAPGTYELRVAVYAWETGARLPAMAQDNGQEGDLLPLGTFTVR